MPNIKDIGTKLRLVRKEKNITLQQLSDSTNLSVGSLSNIERNITSPTLENMERICEALEISIGDILLDNRKDKIVVRRYDRDISIDKENSIRYETVDFGADRPKCTYITVAPNSEFKGKWWNREYDSVCTVISGHMTIIIENSAYNLFEGDTILIKANNPYSVYNTSNLPCLTYWVNQKESE